jgi:Protein of unknown function (DUF2690)
MSIARYSRMIRVRAVIGVAVATAGLLLALTPSVALGVTCSGSGCNGTSPETTGCAASASTLASHQIYDRYTGANIGYVELRGSSVCKTRWARTTSRIGSQPLLEEVDRSDGKFYMDQDIATSGYSPQVYVGTTYTATACGAIYDFNHQGACTSYH